MNNTKSFKKFFPRLLNNQEIAKSLDTAFYKESLPLASRWLRLILAGMLDKKETHPHVQRAMSYLNLAYLCSTMGIRTDTPPKTLKAMANMAKSFLYALHTTGYDVTSFLKKYLDEQQNYDYIAELRLSIKNGNLDKYVSAERMYGKTYFTAIITLPAKVSDLRHRYGTGTGRTAMEAKQTACRKLLNKNSFRVIPQIAPLTKKGNHYALFEEKLKPASLFFTFKYVSINHTREILAEPKPGGTLLHRPKNLWR